MLSYKNHCFDHMFLNPTVQPRGARAPGLPLDLFPKNAVGAKREKHHLFYMFLLQKHILVKSWGGGYSPASPRDFPKNGLGTE